MCKNSIVVIHSPFLSKNDYKKFQKQIVKKIQNESGGKKFVVKFFDTNESFNDRKIFGDKQVAAVTFVDIVSPSIMTDKTWEIEHSFPEIRFFFRSFEELKKSKILLVIK